MVKYKEYNKDVFLHKQTVIRKKRIIANSKREAITYLLYKIEAKQYRQVLFNFSHSVGFGKDEITRFVENLQFERFDIFELANDLMFCANADYTGKKKRINGIILPNIAE